MIKKNKFIILIIIVVVFLEFYKIPYNSYLLLKRPFEERMISNYGYCDKEGYGYVKYIIENYNIDNNLTIINKNPSPGIYSLLKLKNDKNDDKIVLINFPETIDGNIFDQQIKKYWSDESYIDISKFKLIHQYGNCYYLRR
tara:strand:- start:29 stop:451 length:423 start_codon:yes stop_codon:yes gene_type:complete